ncbi:MAG: flagellar hook-basal body complex protein FliE [Spirochaetales bacterium]|nr:flagellar hook-basal body complex protein FliE [Spirochaetales bacterium]
MDIKSVSSTVINSVASADSKNSRHLPIGEQSEETKSFSGFLSEALNTVNNSVHDSEALSQAFIVDPASVDVHDVTIAMAKANMAVSLTKNVVDEAIRAYKEITNLR